MVAVADGAGVGGAVSQPKIDERDEIIEVHAAVVVAVADAPQRCAAAWRGAGLAVARGTIGVFATRLALRQWRVARAGGAVDVAALTGAAARGDTADGVDAERGDALGAGGARCAVGAWGR